GTAIIVLPRTFTATDLAVRVAVIDSGIDKDGLLDGLIVAEKSFINSSYGYAESDSSLDDSSPHGTPHGTYVASIIADNSPNAVLINAKVVSDQNVATESAIIQALIWAIDEQDCDIINLSLGGPPSNNDQLKSSMEWAFDRGVTVVAAVGNNGQNGVSGSSVESPAVYPQVVAVAAVDDNGQPFSFSGRGPLRNRTAKPDISARGSHVVNGGAVFGTSFAAPKATAVIAEIVAYCKLNSWSWTPGMIKATLLASASPLSSESWEVGSGLVNLDGAKRILDDTPVKGNLPLVAWMTPSEAPYEFERWFVNSTNLVEFSVFASGNVSFDVSFQGLGASWVQSVDSVFVNQSGAFDVSVRVESSVAIDQVQVFITLIAPEYRYLRAQLSFDASVPISRIAFDVSHSPWWIDSIYGQFRALYERITQVGIAVEEISERSQLNLKNLMNYDAVLVLDPCGWDRVLIDDGIVNFGSIRYSPKEIDAYEAYWKSGGGVLVAGLSNSSIDVEGANMLLTRFNMTLEYDHIPSIVIYLEGVASTLLVTDMASHRVTQGVDSFDFVGCSMGYSGRAHKLASVELMSSQDEVVEHTVMVGSEWKDTGRMIGVATNFFLDNWGLHGLYQSEDNSRLILQIVYWLIGWYDN
ncbi:MAG: S8 family peptidase, partial [Candidatus Thorarchaeota archaeon]